MSDSFLPSRLQCAVFTINLWVFRFSFRCFGPFLIAYSLPGFVLPDQKLTCSMVDTFEPILGANCWKYRWNSEVLNESLCIILKTYVVEPRNDDVKLSTVLNAKLVTKFDMSYSVLQVRKPNRSLIEKFQIY